MVAGVPGPMPPDDGAAPEELQLWHCGQDSRQEVHTTGVRGQLVARADAHGLGTDRVDLEPAAVTAELAAPGAGLYLIARYGWGCLDLGGLGGEACMDPSRPPLLPIIQRLTLPDASGSPVAVLRVDVPRSLFVHQSPGGYFYRIGSSKRQMPPDYLARLFQQRSQTRLIRFDEQTVDAARTAELAPALWQRFATPLTHDCLLYTSPSPRDRTRSRMPSSAWKKKQKTKKKK